MADDKSLADELLKLQSLKEKGAITESEFNELKASLLERSNLHSGTETTQTLPPVAKKVSNAWWLLVPALLVLLAIAGSFHESTDQTGNSSGNSAYRQPDEVVEGSSTPLPNEITDQNAIAASSQPFVVEMALDVSSTNPPEITGTTNLPDGTALSVTLIGDMPACYGHCGFMANATVKNGHFAIGAELTRNDKLIPDSYTIHVGTPTASVEPESVQRVIGDSGQNLRGPYVVTMGANGERIPVRFPRNSAPTYYESLAGLMIEYTQGMVVADDGRVFLIPASSNVGSETGAPPQPETENLPQPQGATGQTTGTSTTANNSQSTLCTTDSQPSFDCSRAVSLSAKTICSSPELREADCNLSLAFGVAAAIADANGRTESLKLDERAWIKLRDQGCAMRGDYETCLLQWTQNRTAVLNFRNFTAPGQPNGDTDQMWNSSGNSANQQAPDQVRAQGPQDNSRSASQPEKQNLEAPAAAQADQSQDPMRKSHWRTITGDNGVAVKINMTYLRRHTNGSVDVIVYEDELGDRGIVDERFLKQFIFDCKGHYIDTTMISVLMPAPPRSVAGEIQAIVCTAG